MMAGRWTAFLMGLLMAATTAPIASAALWGRPTEAELLMLGKAALEDGLYDLAEKRFEEYVKKVSAKDRKAEGTLLHARALYGQGRYEDVVELLNKRSKWASNSEHVGGFAYWKTRAQCELGAYEEALKLLGVFEEAFADDETIPQAVRLRALCHLKVGNAEAALADYELFHREYRDTPKAPDNLLDWARTWIGLDEGKKAQDKLNELIETFPVSAATVEARLLLAGMMVARQDREAATEQLLAVTDKAWALPEKRSAAWFALADVYEAQTNFASALQALEQSRAVSADPKAKAQADIAAGRLELLQGRIEEGVALFKKTIQKLPGDPMAGESQLLLSELLLQQEQYEASAVEFQHYLESFDVPEGRARAYRGKAWALWELQRYAEAAETFEKAYTLYASSPEKERALLKAADCLFANEQYKQAFRHYEQVAQEYPRSPLVVQSRFQSAECLARQGMLDEAANAFAELTRLHPRTSYSEQALMRVSLIKEEQRDWEQAVRMYERVMEEFPGGLFFARALHGRGLIHYRLGWFDQALEDFERVVREFPGSEFVEQARFMRGWCLYLLGDADRALQLCEEFIEQFPKSKWAQDVLFWLGEYHFNEGDYEKAEAHWVECATRYPVGGLADKSFFWAGKASAKQKKFLRAIEHYNQLTENYPQSPLFVETRFAQGDALSVLGKFDGAIVAFEEIIVNFPQSYLVDQARGRIGDCRFTLGGDDPERYREALDAYRAVMESSSSSADLQMQAEYKMGRCREKLGENEEAFEHYMNVVYRYFIESEKGADVRWFWFTRAAFNAAALKEGLGQWREAVRIYHRVIAAGVPAAPDAKKRIQQILFDQWLPFFKEET